MAPAVAFRNVLLGNVITSGHYPLHNQSGASSKEQCTRDAQLDRGSPALLGPIKAHGPRRGREVREDTWALRKAVWRRQEHDARLQSRVQLPFLLTAACWEYELKTPYAREECCLVKQEFGKANRYGFMCAVRLWKGELHIPCGRYPTIAALHVGAFREKIADRPLPAELALLREGGPRAATRAMRSLTGRHTRRPWCATKFAGYVHPEGHGTDHTMRMLERAMKRSIRRPHPKLIAERGFSVRC
jgi:hypothetical protein